MGVANWKGPLLDSESELAPLSSSVMLVPGIKPLSTPLTVYCKVVQVTPTTKFEVRLAPVPLELTLQYWEAGWVATETE